MTNPMALYEFMISMRWNNNNNDNDREDHLIMDDQQKFYTANNMWRNNSFEVTISEMNIIIMINLRE